MDRLTSEQDQIGKEIEKTSYAYQRLSPERKTVSYLHETLQNIEQLWQRFEQNNDNIRVSYGDQRAHEYFTSDFYNKVKYGYEALNNELKQLIQHAQGDKSEPSKTSKKAIDASASASRSTPHVTSKQNYQNETSTSVHPLIRKQRQAMTVLENTITTLSSDQPKQYYEVKLETIQRQWNQIEDTNNAIWEGCTTVQENAYTLTEYMQLGEKVQDTVIKIKQILDAEANTSTSSPTSPTQHTTHNQTMMKLPKLVLPRFDGNYLHWQQFYDLFVQMVHNQNMPNSQKMWYLKMNLSGEASKLIRHLQLSENNYELAWNILKDRYENKRLLVTALLDKLIAQSKINSESANSLKALHDTTKECLLSLQNMGLAVRDHWDPIIMHMLLKKLDNHTHALYEQTLKSPRELQSVEKFLNFIEVRFQALEALGSKVNNTKDTQKSSKPTALVSNKVNKSQCWICSGSHAIYFCDNFKKMSIDERQRKAKDLNLCINCLKKGHIWSKCQSRGCLKCGKKHNTLLHNVSSKPDQETQDKSSNHKPTSPTSLAAQTREGNEGYVFLATAIAETMDKEGNILPCRILLDSGSQLNFISENLRKKLRLSKSDVTMDIAGIGKSSTTVKGKLYIKLKSKHHNYTTELEVYEVKQITSQQPREYINVEGWQIPEEITLADPEFNKPQSVDILLGAELYGEIMRNGQIKLSEGLPILQNTTLGWIVLGRVANVDYT